MPKLERNLKLTIQHNHVEIYTLDYLNCPQEFKEYANLRRQFGEGESAAMAIAKERNCTLASDDLSATVKYCKRHNIDLIGSLGILYDAYQTGILEGGQADRVLTDMIQNTNYNFSKYSSTRPSPALSPVSYSDFHS